MAEKTRLFRESFFVTLFIVCFGQSTINPDDILDHPVDICAGVVENCYCTNVVVDCDGATFTNLSAIRRFFSQETTRVSITNGNLQKLLQGDFPNDSQIKYLNVSGNPLEVIHKAAFEDLANLTVLDLSLKPSNFVLSAESISIALIPLNQLEELTIRHANFAENPSDLVNLTSLSNLKRLDLSSNGIVNVDSDWLAQTCNQFKITDLNFSNNSFTRLPVSECMTNLEVLDVSNNEIEFLTSVEVDILESFMNLKMLYLGGNPWSCSCQMSAMYPWLNETKLPMDFNEMTCFSSEDEALVGEKMQSVQLHDMCKPRIIICYGAGPVSKLVPVVTGLAAVLTLAVVMGLALYWRRKKQKRKNGKESRIIEDFPKTPVYSRIV